MYHNVTKEIFQERNFYRKLHFYDFVAYEMKNENRIQLFFLVVLFMYLNLIGNVDENLILLLLR